MARLASPLAHLLDDAIEVRGSGIGVRDFASAFLGIEPVDLMASAAPCWACVSTSPLWPWPRDRHPPARIIGEDVEEPPRWEQVDLGESSPRIPIALAAVASAAAVGAGLLFRIAGEIDRLWVVVPAGEIDVRAAVARLVIAALFLCVVWRVALEVFSVR